MRTRLNERDLNRIVRRVVKEGLITQHKECTSEWTQEDTKGGSWEISGGILYLYGADNSKFCKVSTIK